MKFLKSKKLNKKLFLFVTSLDQIVIARPNFKISSECWNSLPEYSEELQNDFVINSPIFYHLQKLLNEDKYGFLFESQDEKEDILETVGNIQLPTIYYNELEWLKRFGYYFHHSLAISLILAKFGQDLKLNSSLLREVLRIALIHDIGISRLPYNVLFSHELFHEDDRIIMQQHTFISYLLIGYYSRKKDHLAGLVALHHHTPLKEMEIAGNLSKECLEIAWMIHNMDIFDALISNRPFRPAYKVESALLYLKQVNGALRLPMDIVHWLEKKYALRKVSHLHDQLIPYHPELQIQQMN